MPSNHPGTVSGVIATDGTCTLRISHQKSGITWRIMQISIRSTPSSNFNISTDFASFPMLTDTVVIGQRTAQGLPYIDIGDHDELVFHITAGIATAQITLTYFYEELNEA